MWHYKLLNTEVPSMIVLAFNQESAILEQPEEEEMKG